MANPYDLFGGLGQRVIGLQQQAMAWEQERLKREYERSMFQGMQNSIRVTPTQQPEEPKESPLLVLLTGE